MPPLLKMTLREAVATLANRNLKIDKIVGEGVVIKQSPPAYRTVEDGTPIQLVLGSEKALAEEELEEQGELADSDGDKGVTGSLESTPELDLAELKLRLGHNGNGVDLPLAQSSKPAWIRPPHIVPTPQAAPDDEEEMSYPDLDTIASQSPNPKEGKATWEKWQKQLNSEKNDASAAADASAVPDPNAPSDEGEMSPAITDQVPNFDGTEEMDPNSPNSAPIEISTQRAKPDRDSSLYNMKSQD